MNSSPTHPKLLPLTGLALLISGCQGEPPDLPSAPVIPSAEQVAYQEMELLGFVHFSMNTFTDKEWGFGDESPARFDPADLDTDQWARVAAEVGMGELILTAKHHDGFTLWPSDFSHHSVARSPWRDGSGDLVAEFVTAARRHGLKVGLYLSPWDRNHPEYGRDAYLQAYRGQLRELLTRYGEINEIWVDGANGGTGYYGGANEERRIDRRTYYRWPETMAMLKAIQPRTLIFSDAGPDIRWIGNERGFAGETNWSTIDGSGIVIGEADVEYLNTGDPQGRQWMVPLCDTSIRPGWFYHPDQDDEVKSPQELVDLYYRSVGRNCVLLLNIPPDRRGRFHDTDVEALREFRRILDDTFAGNLAAGASAGADNIRDGHSKFSPAHLVDGRCDTYWAADDDRRAAVLELQLTSVATFDRIVLQEPIRFGQRISSFSVEGMVGGEWSEIGRGTTVGHKRILRVPPVSTRHIRLVILEALAPPALCEIGLFLSSPDETRGREVRSHNGP
jgi:alpha-L-fucosidase